MKPLFTNLAWGAMLLVASQAPLRAQTITATVPTGATVVSAMADMRDNNRIIWLCQGRQLSLRGNNNTIYAEANAVVSISGNGNLVYTKSLNTLQADGNNNTIYVSGPAGISMNGNNNLVTAPASASVNFEGQNNSRAILSSLVYNYSVAPSGGCNAITSTDVALDGEKDILYPNPVETGTALQLKTEMPITNVEILDLQGRQVAAYPPQASLDTRGIAPGTYTVRLVTAEGRVEERLVVE